MSGLVQDPVLKPGLSYHAILPSRGPGPTWGLWLFLSCLVVWVVMEPVCPEWGAPGGRRSRPVALLCVVPSQLAMHRSGQLLVMMSHERETCGTWGPGRSPLGGPSAGTGSGIAGTSHSHYQALCPDSLLG